MSETERDRRIGAPRVFGTPEVWRLRGGRCKVLSAGSCVTDGCSASMTSERLYLVRPRPVDDRPEEHCADCALARKSTGRAAIGDHVDMSLPGSAMKSAEMRRPPSEVSKDGEDSRRVGSVSSLKSMSRATSWIGMALVCALDVVVVLDGLRSAARSPTTLGTADRGRNVRDAVQPRPKDQTVARAGNRGRREVATY